MGQTVPKIKAIASHDYEKAMGHIVQMAEDLEDIAETAWRDAFRARVRDAQGDRKDKDMAKLLGISPERYRKYVSGGAARKTVIPPRYLTKFCLITNIELEWLLDGPEEQEAKKPRKSPEIRAKATKSR